jgi:hypothetical protein
MVVCFIKYALADEQSFYVVRPQVLGRNANNTDELVAFNFGTKLWFQGDYKDENGEYAIVRDIHGFNYLIRKPYIYYANYEKLRIDKEGICLSPLPQIQEGEFGFCAGGMRYDEDAIILYETEDLFYVVTSEGFSGYVSKDNPHIVSYN